MITDIASSLHFFDSMRRRTNRLVDVLGIGWSATATGPPLDATTA